MAKQAKFHELFVFNMDDFGHGDLEDLMRLASLADRNEKRVFKAILADGQYVVYVAAPTIREAVKFADIDFQHPFNEKWLVKDFKEVRI